MPYKTSLLKIQYFWLIFKHRLSNYKTSLSLHLNVCSIYPEIKTQIWSHLPWVLHLAWNALLHRSHRAHGSLCVACKIMMVDSAESNKSLSTRSHLHAHDGEHIQDQRWHRPQQWPQRPGRPRASHSPTRPNSLPRSGGRSSSWWGNSKGERKKEKKKGTSSHLTRGAEADGRAGRCLAFIRRHGLYY